MTLAEIRATFPDLFYRQEWFNGHAFMDVQPSGDLPTEFTLSEVDGFERPLVRAVDLAARYVTSPEDSRWRRFIWTDDVDSWGNRVYVAGCGMYGCEGFQIHRHLTPAAYWVRL